MKLPDSKWMRDQTTAIASPTSGWQWGKAAVVILLALALLALLSKWSGDSHRYPRSVVNKVKSLVQESIRWSATSSQDTNQLLSLMHATYALAYLNVARHLVADQDIVRMVGVQPQELMHELQEKQDGAVQKVCAECPQLQPASGRFTAHTGWLG